MRKQRNITSTELKIETLDLVLHSTMKQRHIDSPLTGRHSDCFVYVISGKAEYRFRNKVLSVSAGDILYLPYRSVYSFDITTPIYDVIYVDFAFEQNEEYENAPDLFFISSSLNMENCFLRLHKKYHMKQFGSKTETLSLLYEIYAKILKTCSSYTPSKTHESLESAVSFILSHYTDKAISLHEIVAMTHLSEGHFRRLFKKIFHVSPIEYILNLRLEYAKNLLLTTNQNLADISDFSGFSNLPYFCLQFKKKIGYTPSEFRKNNKNQRHI